jgi:nucleoid-associated protein YgaU
MTKETKIGLLVGLAFIILFAIILSEKGATRGTSAPLALTEADFTAKGDRPGDASGPLADAGRLPVESSLKGREQDKAVAKRSPALAKGGPAAKETIGQPIPDEGDPLSPLPEAVVQRLNQGMGDSDEEAAPAGSTEEGALTLEQAVAAALEMEPESPGEAGGEAKAPVTKEVVPDTGPRKSGRPVRIKLVHVVEPGESLGKIAAKHYGRATPSRIKAIFEANRAVLKSIDLVRASDELKIPAMEEEGEVLFEAASDFVVGDLVAAQSRRREGAVRIPRPVEKAEPKEPSRRPAAGSRKADSSAEGRAATREFRWYEVRERDTLSSIAKLELGNERRFLELYRLNRDLIKNKNVIRPGLRIRLPGRASGSEAADSRVVASLGDGGAGEQ